MPLLRLLLLMLLMLLLMVLLLVLLRLKLQPQLLLLLLLLRPLLLLLLLVWSGSRHTGVDRVGSRLLLAAACSAVTSVAGDQVAEELVPLPLPRAVCCLIE